MITFTRPLLPVLVSVCMASGFIAVSTGCTIKPGEYDIPGFGAEPEDDSPLSVSVREALEHRPDINTARIDVSSDEDVVTLSGRVESDIERESAGQVTEQVPGVRMVLNNLFAVSD